MATLRLPVNLKYNNFYDGQQIEEDELTDEQDRNIGIDAANVANFMGSGIVKADPISLVIFDTNNLNAQQLTFLDGYTFDGQNVYVGTPLISVSDEVYGVHLEVELSDVHLEGSASSRVCVIGDTFGDELVHDDLLFESNCSKITQNRYKSIRAILFNDFSGNTRGSKWWARDGYDLVGRCVIREAQNMMVSPDSVVAAQTEQPNQFFYNFIPARNDMTFEQMLADAVGADKSVSDLNIAMDSIGVRTLDIDDVTTEIGQKFKLDGNNIQKISVLLSVAYDEIDGYDWSGYITMTLRALQTDVACPIDPVPDNAVDFDPDPSVIAQLSLDAQALEKQGILLDGYPQIVNFVFTGNTIADPIRSPLESGKYYAFSLNRSGDVHTGTLQIQEASNRYDNGYMIYFDGSQWTNLYDSDMWFSIEGDYVKVVDGTAYDQGIGVEVPKVAKNSNGVEVPYYESLIPFYSSAHDIRNYVLLEKDEEPSDPEQDQRTGNDVYSRLSPAPVLSLINQSSLGNLLVTNPAPILLAIATDINSKGNPTQVTGTIEYFGLVIGNEFNILLPDADIRTFNWENSIIYPNSSKSISYRVASVELINDAYGDVDGDGEISITDYSTVVDWRNKWGSSLSLADAYVQERIQEGRLETVEFLRADVNGDGVVDAVDESLIYQYVNRDIVTFPAGSTFSRTKITVENLLNPLTTDVDIPVADSDYDTIPFVAVGWEIEYFATWNQDNLIIENIARDMPTTFVDGYSESNPGGQNNFYIPGNALIAEQLLNPDGTPYSIDFEATQITLDIPIVDSYGNPIFIDGYTGILLFDSFVYESNYGKTPAGFEAMKYSDGTYVQVDDFTDGKVKIVPTLQSTANEYVVPFGGTINDIVGMYYDPTTSLMTLYIKDQYDDDGYGNILRPKSTKVNVTIYLKKAGFANETLEVTQSQILALLGL